MAASVLGWSSKARRPNGRQRLFRHLPNDAFVLNAPLGSSAVPVRDRERLGVGLRDVVT